MYDHAFTTETVRQEVRSIDFFNDGSLKDGDKLSQHILKAVEFLNDPAGNLHEFVYGTRNGKQVASAGTYRCRLAMRKIDRNLRFALGVEQDSRESVVRSLRAALAEGVAYRVYRLDIRSFYESFDADYVMEFLKVHRHITTGTNRVIGAILDHHARRFGRGLPRGLPFSATLAEAMLGEFDRRVKNHPDVFFYRRYVDDLTIVTSQREDKIAFQDELSRLLPNGLEFKRGQKHFVLSTETVRPKDTKPTNTPHFRGFDYLGYRFNVAVAEHRPFGFWGREVWLDIADSKVAKIKTRVIRSFLSYLQTSDFSLLERRIRHLTSNLSLLDRSRGLRRLVGIYFNYKLIDCDRSEALPDLDRFISNALCSTRGRVYRQLSAKLNQHQRRRLATHSFVSGAKKRHFFQMGVKELGLIQGCWKHG